MAITTQMRTDVSQLYVALFGRAPDGEGLGFWVQQLDAGQSMTQIADTMYATTPARAYYPSFMTNGEIIASFYVNVLGRTADVEGAAYWTAKLNTSGATPGSVIAELINVVANYGGTDPAGLESAALFNNRVDVAQWYGEQNGTITGATTILTAVTADPATVTAAMSGSVASGQTFTLTTGVDTFTGTSGNDTFIALDNGVAGETTLTLGDSLNGGAGADTLKIFSENDNLSLTKVNVSNIEHLVVVNSLNDWDDFDVAGRSFQTITLDVGGLVSGGLDVVNINADTAVTLTNIYADDESNFINWKTDNTSTTGNTSLTVSKIDTSGGYSEDVYSYATFTKATTVNTVINVADITDGEDDGYYFYGEHVLNTGTTKGVAVNTTINVSNVEAPDYAGQYFYVEQEGDSVNNFTVNLTNTTNFEIYLELDDNGNGSSKTDVVTYNLTNVKNDNDGTRGGQAYLGSNGFETINVNVLSKSSLEEIYDNYGNGNNQVLNVVAAADLSVEDVYLDDANVTVNVSGAGNVDLGTLYAGDGDADDVVTVDASALTGNFKVYDSNGYAATITSGSGNDTIKVGGFKTAVSTGAGDDKVDTNGYDFGNAAAKKLDGGTGRNTIVINEGTLLTAAAAANISNFQVLDITGANGGDTFDMSVEASLDAVVAKGALDAVTIDKAAAGTTVSLTSADSVNTTVASLTYALKTATGTNDNFSLSLNASDTDVKDNSKNGQLTVTAVIANAIESFSISTNATTTDGSTDGKTLFAAKDYTNTISSLAGDAVKTVTLTGAANLTITDVTSTTLTKVDASAMTGKLNITLDDSANAGAVAVLGGSAADTITLTGNVAANNIIQGNGGADVITLAAAGTKETVRIAADTDAVLKMTDTTTPVVTPVVYDTIKGYDTVINFSSGEDKIELSSALGLAAGDARSSIAGKGTIGGGTAASEADLAAAFQTLVGTGASFFNDGTSNRALAAVAIDGDGTNIKDGTLVLIDTDADGNFTNGTDQAIYLVGTSSVVISDFIFG